MRQVSSDLLAVQKVRSARASVSCTVEERGATRGAGAVQWKQLVSNAGQTIQLPAALVSTSDGNILRFYGGGVSMWQETIENPSNDLSWAAPSAAVQIGSNGAYALAALRYPAGGDGIRLFYIDANDGDVYYRASGDDGASWGSPFTVYNGGDATNDVVVARIPGTGFAQDGFVGFSTNSLGVYRARFGNGNSSSWSTVEYPFNNWQAAGIVVDRTGLSSGEVRVLVYRQRANGMSRLRELTFDGSTFSNPRDLDRTSAGLVGLALNNYRFFQLPELGAVQLGIGGEGGFGSGFFEGVVSLFFDGELLVDETIMLPGFVVTASAAYTGLAEHGDDLYVAGAVGVWRGAGQGTVTDETLIPTKYDYDENQLNIEFPVTTGSMTLKVGQILKLDRTLSWGTQTGTETIRFYVVRVERGTDKVVVVAVDVLGFLGSGRCRRPMIVSDGTDGAASVLRRAAARLGLGVTVDNTDLETESVLPMTLAASESLLSAAYRMGSQAEWYIVPNNDGTFGLTMIIPGDSDGGDYDDTAHQYGQTGNQQIVDQAAEVTDFRQLGFSHILGTLSTDPQDGSALGMATGAWVANTRPISFSLTNRTYNTYLRVEAAAAAEGARQKKLNIDAEMTTPANLALELYDKVAVTVAALGWSAREFRVRRIHERWDRGRLTQRVWMGSED
ncbi:MAG: hypothetical protein WDZ49_13535 [Litorilinea sp.]